MDRSPAPKQVISTVHDRQTCDLCTREIALAEVGVVFRVWMNDAPASVVSCRWCIGKVNQVAQKGTYRKDHS